MIIEFFSRLPQLWHDELRGMFDGSLGATGLFLTSFPFLLSAIWSLSATTSLALGALRPQRKGNSGEAPNFCVLVPFYGCPEAALRTVRSLAEATPRPDEIVIIDDGSPPQTSATNVAALPEGVRMVRLPCNVGKAAALNYALRLVSSEIVVCLDSDTMAETVDWSRMLAQFTTSPSLGALTGKIRPACVESFVQLLQAIDYLAVICMVKCAEKLWGGLTTVSGAWVAYRREALIQCGGWNEETSAEDIDLSWRMQAAGWRISYDPRWSARVEMARCWKSLWLQRRRWSSGMGRALREHLFGAFQWRARHLPVAVVAVLSAVWMWLIAGTLLSHVADTNWTLATLGGWLQHHTLTLCLCAAAFGTQIMVGILIDRGPWRRYPLMILLSPFYLVYFWLVLFTSYIAGFTRGVLRRDRGRWVPTAEEDGGEVEAVLADPTVFTRSPSEEFFDPRSMS